MHSPLSSLPAFVVFVLALATAVSLVPASPVPTTSRDKNKQVHLSPPRNEQTRKRSSATQRTNSMSHHFLHLYRCGTTGACGIKCQIHLPNYDKFENCISNCLAPYDIRIRYEHPDMNSTLWPPAYNKSSHEVPLLNLPCTE
ncbi:BZ3500_MvSof-1268-A1-R1_Chr2-3g05387 [Microbotryum saponariae]|uniref:BZ3500_MvSof-1268-A1-R1_Chr2-3g05387 protein n=1 Tax=Microbotryum saponariae TaxID=289078 RepID=A0A2X0N7Z9_9BASI|nr:BZ3500_MvSof-1268-A1-R1_Chr2-3g05387 [Microbotryum saponariae]SDA01336.1 BZ3501_MvSof-1269-A2-R1_Chr2-2g05060 [Microbotryum saponariae]